MSVMFFAMDINAILEDGTEVTNVKGFVIDNKTYLHVINYKVVYHRLVL